MFNAFFYTLLIVNLSTHAMEMEIDAPQNITHTSPQIHLNEISTKLNNIVHYYNEQLKKLNKPYVELPDFVALELGPAYPLYHTLYLTLTNALSVRTYPLPNLSTVISLSLQGSSESKRHLAGLLWFIIKTNALSNITHLEKLPLDDDIINTFFWGEKSLLKNNLAPTLQTLSLKGGNLSNEQICILSSLKQLNTLSLTAVTADQNCLVNVLKLTTLKSLNLHSMSLTDNDLDYLFKNSAESTLEELLLYFLDRVRSMPTSLSCLKTLKGLYLYELHNLRFFPSIQSLPNLSHLHFSQAFSLEKFNLTGWEKMTHLKSMYISGYKDKSFHNSLQKTLPLGCYNPHTDLMKD